MIGIVKKPGRQATKLEQVVLTPLIPKRSPDEKIVIHHITENAPLRAQIEVMRYCPVHGIKGERIFL